MRTNEKKENDMQTCYRREDWEWSSYLMKNIDRVLLKVIRKSGEIGVKERRKGGRRREGREGRVEG